MVSFVPMDREDEDSVSLVLQQVDNCMQYVMNPATYHRFHPRTPWRCAAPSPSTMGCAPTSVLSKSVASYVCHWFMLTGVCALYFMTSSHYIRYGEDEEVRENNNEGDDATSGAGAAGE